MECNKADVTTGNLPSSALEARYEAYLLTPMMNLQNLE